MRTEMTETTDAVQPFFRTGNYRPVTEEVSATDLPAEGPYQASLS